MITLSSLSEISQRRDDVFLKSENQCYTYADLYSFVYQINDIFDVNELSAGKKIALLSETNDELILAIAALWLLNKPFIPLSPKLTDREILNYLNTLQPDIVLTDDKNRSRSIVTSPKLQTIPEFLKGYHPKNILRAVSDDENSIFGYFFTSGTTGKPKIVPLKRRQLFSAAYSSALNFKPGRNGLWLLCMPLNHIGGISVVLRTLVYGSGIYRTDGFDESVIRPLLSENKEVEVASLVPTMLQRLLKDDQFHTHSRFKVILLGGSATSPRLMEDSGRRDIPVIPSFGMTETCAQIIAVSLTKRNENPVGSSGTIFKGNEIEIRDTTGDVLKSNERGTIWLRGPQVFDGYYPASAENITFDDAGWFYTGDYGSVDEKGNIFIYSRRKDLIVTGGENVSPAEVESFLEQIPGISEAAVIGWPDEEWGHIVTAIIVPQNDTQITLDSLREKLRDCLSGYKLPRKMVITEQLPRTASGKIIRNKLLDIIRKKESEKSD